MTKIMVKIMVEVLSILGIVTKGIAQGKISMSFYILRTPRVDLRAERFLKKLAGMKEVEAALQRLDQLTQEEARMAASEALMITRGIDDSVKDVNETVHNVDMKVEGVDCKVQGVNDRVKSVDLKVGSVIKGKLYLYYLAPNLSSTLVRCERDWRSHTTSSQSSQRPKPFVIF